MARSVTAAPHGEACFLLLGRTAERCPGAQTCVVVIIWLPWGKVRGYFGFISDGQVSWIAFMNGGRAPLLLRFAVY